MGKSVARPTRFMGRRLGIVSALPNVEAFCLAIGQDAFALCRFRQVEGLHRFAGRPSFVKLVCKVMFGTAVGP